MTHGLSDRRRGQKGAVARFEQTLRGARNIPKRTHPIQSYRFSKDST
jgi:hypothetical protein